MSRIYRLTKQERDYFCIPSVIQAILRRRGLEEAQERIAAEGPSLANISFIIAIFLLFILKLFIYKYYLTAKYTFNF